MTKKESNEFYISNSYYYNHKYGIHYKQINVLEVAWMQYKKDNSTLSRSLTFLIHFDYYFHEY